MEKLGIYYNEITVLTPAPGTDLYREHRERLITDDYELYDYLHSLLPTKLPPKTFYAELARLYRRAYSPLRAVRIGPAGVFPSRPGHLVRSVYGACRDYFRIRNAYASLEPRPD
jgi:hypothetical protein